MWKLAFCLVCLILLPRAACGQERAEKPYLVLDARGHTGRVWDVFFSPDARELISVSYDKTIRIWDVATDESLRTLRPPMGSGNDGRLIGGAMSPDGTTLAIGGTGVDGDRNVVYLISLASGKIFQVLRGHTKPINTVAFSPDGKVLGSAANDRTARLWDWRTGQVLHELRGHTHYNVNSIAFSALGDFVGTACHDGTARLWSVKTGENEITLSHPGSVTWASFSPDEKTVATAAGKDLCLWNRQGELVKEIELDDYLVNCQFISAGKEVFFTGHTSGLYELESGRVQKLPPHGAVTGGQVSADGRHVTTATATGAVYLWNRADGKLLRTFASRGQVSFGVGWQENGYRIGFGHDGVRPTQPVANQTAPLTRAFDFATLELQNEAAGQWQRVAPEQAEISCRAIDELGASVKVTRMAPGAKLPREAILIPPAKGLGTGDPSIYAYAAQGREQILLGNGNGELFLFDLDEGRLLREYRGPVGEIWAIAPAPSGRYFLSAANDCTLSIWRPDRESPLLSLFVAGQDWIAWTREGYYAASPGGEALLGWQVNNGPSQMGTFYPAAQFRDSLYRPDVIRRLLEAGSVEQALALADAARGQQTALVNIAEVLPPFVMITRPDQPQLEVSEPSVEVHCIAKPVGQHPVTAVRLLLDGRPYPGTEHVKQFDPPRTGEIRLAWTVQVQPGKHTLAVQAESAVSKAVSEPVEIFSGVRGATRAGSPNADPVAQKELLPALYVLAMGISDYPGSLKLEYAAKDAEAIAAAYGQNSQSLFRKVEVKVLTNAQATRQGMLQGLTWLRKQMTQNDVAVISFAGHGAKDSDGAFYLMPVDVDPEDLLSTGVPGDQIKRTLTAIPGRFVLLLDACHSGAVDGERRRAAESLTDDLVRDLVTDDYGIVVMCSAMGREFALESPTVEHGYFTLAIVEGLRGKADYDGDRVVHLNELDLYVTNRVKELTRGKQHPVTARPASIRSFPLSVLSQP